VQDEPEVLGLLIALRPPAREGKDNKFQATPLIWAVMKGRTDMVRLLAERGANLNATETKNGMSALLAAAVKGHVDTVKVLLEKGADIKTRDRDGRTALM
jgi:ankyrin repeat protein